MSRSKFDPAKLADLVNEESKLSGELRDKSAELNDMHQKAHDSSWDSDENAKYQRLQLHHAQLSRDLEAVRQERVSYEGFEPARARDAQQSPLARFLRKGHQGLEEGELKSHCDLDKSEYGMGGNVEGFSIELRTPRERRLEMATRTTAVKTLPREIAPRVVDDLAYFGGVAKMAQQFMTANGNEYRIPNLDAAAQEGEILSSDGTAVSALDLGTFESANFVARTCSSKSINITRELITDSVFDIEAYAERQAVRRMGRAWNKAFTTNGNTATPVGVMTSATVTPDTAAATKFTYLEALALEYAINRAYREQTEGMDGLNAEMGGVIGYMASDGAERIIRSLMDSDMRPLWQPGDYGLPGGGTGIAPVARFNGWPLRVNGHLPAVTTDKKPLLFGNFSYYGIRTVNSVEIFRFMDSRTMQNNQVECLAFSRRDGRPMGGVASNICEAYSALVTA